MMRTLEEVLDQAIDSRLSSVWTALPGRVLAFDAASATATVQPFPATWQDGQPVAIPEIADVPVAYPAGGGCVITYPLAIGDVVLLIFSTLPMARYRADGATGNPVDTRRFDLSDAWAIPLGSGVPKPATPGATVVAPPTGGEVRLGGPAATLGVARQTDSVAPTADMVAWYAAVSAAIVTAGGPAVPPPATFGTVVGGSAVVKAV